MECYWPWKIATFNKTQNDHQKRKMYIRVSICVEIIEWNYLDACFLENWPGFLLWGVSGVDCSLRPKGATRNPHVITMLNVYNILFIEVWLEMETLYNQTVT